jgi:[ribosomal protein S18]-alanine N-acetyltransferase
MSQFAIETVETSNAGALRAAAEEIAAVHEAAGQRPWGVNGYLRLLQAPATLALVGRSVHGTVGFVLAQRALDEAEIVMIAVAPDAQGQGLGQQLLEALHTILAAGGITRIFLDVAEDNVTALSLYRRTGYLPIGRRKDYYAVAEVGSAPRDALVFAREFGAHTP